MFKVIYMIVQSLLLLPMESCSVVCLVGASTNPFHARFYLNIVSADSECPWRDIFIMLQTRVLSVKCFSLTKYKFYQTLSVLNENNIRIFERHILRKIFGPVNFDNIWRIRNNMEIDKLIEGADIVRFIKAQRIKWLGHIQRMDQARPTGKLLDWNPMETRPVGRPRQRW